MKKLVKLSVAALAISAAMGAAHAAKVGTYAGIGLGASRIGDIDSSNSNGVKTTGMAGNIFAGYNFNENFGLELGYTRYNKLKAQQTLDYGSQTVTAKGTGTISTIDLLAKAYLPMSNKAVNLYALGGISYVMMNADVKAHYSDIMGNEYDYKDNFKAKEFAPKAGVGVSYDINENVTAALEATHLFERSNKGVPEVNMVALRIGYNFG